MRSFTREFPICGSFNSEKYLDGRVIFACLICLSAYGRIGTIPDLFDKLEIFDAFLGYRCRSGLSGHQNEITSCRRCGRTCRFDGKQILSLIGQGMGPIECSYCKQNATHLLRFRYLEMTLFEAFYLFKNCVSDNFTSHDTGAAADRPPGGVSS